MKKIIFITCFVITAFIQHAFANEPDSVYLFAYATAKNNNHNGLHFAWSRDRENWALIGNEYSYLKSDYGRWGSEKRMISPSLDLGADGMWHCVWSLNEYENTFAHAASADLVSWGRQTYPKTATGANCIKPVTAFDQAGATVKYATAAGKFYAVSTQDFKSYSQASEIPATSYHDPGITIELPGGSATGRVHKVAWSLVNKLLATYDLAQYKNGQNNESTRQDSQRFASLQPVDVKILLQPEKTKAISDMLVGVFFEDINYAADGGLYAELVQNRDFEYTPGDKEGRDKNWNSTHSWRLLGENAGFLIDSVSPIHPNNPHYALLKIEKPGAALVNTGFDGYAIKKGVAYKFSIFTKAVKTGHLLVRLVSKKNGVLAQAAVRTGTSSWKKVEATLTAIADATDAELELQPQSSGDLALDMVSLFPQNTFKERPNGLRSDLAQAIANIHPRFIRFPGDCVAHGDGLDNIYRWKNTVGPLESRKPQRNIWSYHQSAGLGYFEYFQFCEDIGAAPVPIIAAGVPCQNSGTGGAGQQGGIPMSDMAAYTQDIIDLVEWANGDAHSKWGKLRADAGHPKPFNLKYIGIGNEDLISDVFEERFTYIFNALKKTHPEISVIGTVGPFFEGTDYEQGWQIADKLQVPAVDEHYYQPTGWFIHNQDFYDKYDRSKSKVYLGEYAAFLPGRPNNLETALSEALYLTALERNGDVVRMTSYAPLLAKEGHTQWNPDLIYFNNSEVKPTAGYEVQKMYGSNAGNEYLPAAVTVSGNQDAVKKRVAVSTVRDTKTGDIILKMVNLLPVAARTTIDLKGIALAGSQGTKTVLQGSPADKLVKPVESNCVITDNFQLELAPYSFTVIRMKTASDRR